MCSDFNQQARVENILDRLINISGYQCNTPVYDAPDNWFLSHDDLGYLWICKLMPAQAQQFVLTFMRTDSTTYTVTCSFWGARPHR